MECPVNLVEVRDLHFAYTPGHPVLHGIDLQVQPGQFVGIVGHTGSGKSTLLSLLLKFYAPQQGQILLDGRPLEGITPARFHEAVGLVPQDPFLLAANARE